MITFDELKTIRDKTAIGKQKDAAIIPRGELERIKQSMIVPDYSEQKRKNEMEKTMM